MITRNQAWTLLTSKLQNKNLIRHCLSVESVMRALAGHFKADLDKWGLVGLLHDGDYELCKDAPERHTLMMLDWLAEMGEHDPEILSAIKSHNYTHTGHNMPSNNLEWSLFACDELTGLIVACALVLPTKKLADLSVESVLKKFPQKSFAAGAKREDIKMCEEKLGIKLGEFVGIALMAMQGIADEIGL